MLDGVGASISQGEFVCILGGNGSGQVHPRKARQRPARTRRGQCERARPRHARQRQPCTSSAATPAWSSRTPTTSWWPASSRTTWRSAPRTWACRRTSCASACRRRWPTWACRGSRSARPAALSGGQKQRVAIAGVLAMEPAILVLDEATAMLDPRGRKGLMRVCRELHERGMTIVMITHFMEEAAAGRPRHRARGRPRGRRRSPPPTCSCRPTCSSGCISTCPSPCALSLALQSARAWTRACTSKRRA